MKYEESYRYSKSVTNANILWILTDFRILPLHRVPVRNVSGTVPERFRNFQKIEIRNFPELPKILKSVKYEESYSFLKLIAFSNFWLIFIDFVRVIKKNGYM